MCDSPPPAPIRHRKSNEPAPVYHHRNSKQQHSYRRRYHYRSRRKIITCSNCNGKGHLFKDCKKPIQSNGLLAWMLCPVTPDARAMLTENHVPDVIDWYRRLYATQQFQLQVCLIQRKHTISFEAFVRGKYNVDELELHRERMTHSERDAIRQHTWEHLYNQVMADKDARYMQRERRRAKMLYDSIDVNKFLDTASTAFDEPTWEFPKGRRFVHENDRECALREFREETNVPSDDVLLTDKWCEEEFCGMNKRMYRNKYYVALIHPNSRGPYLDTHNDGQTAEVQDARMLNYDQAMAMLRPFHEEKRAVLQESYNEIIRILNGNITSESPSASPNVK